MKEYTVIINGVEHTMQLTAEDAERYGDAATPVSTKSGTASNKSRTSANKSKS